MLRIKDTYATVFRPDVKERFVTANLSSSEKLPVKDGEKQEYRNSNWNSVIFVGDDCVQAAKQLKDKDRILIKRGGVRIEPYTDKEGVKKYPPKVVIFEFSIEEKGKKQAQPDEDLELGDEENLPF